MSRFLSLAIIILATLLSYANSLHNPFIWDQEVAIVGNPLIRSWHNLPLIFKTNVEGRRLTGVAYYRPLEVISYMIDYSISKLNPFGWHCSSTLLHLGNCLLLFWLLQRMKINVGIAFLAGLIFAIHPVNTQTVTYSIRGDLLATFFSMWCFHCFLSYYQQGSKLFVFFSIFSYLLALLSKESAVVVPLIIFIYSILFHRPLRGGGEAHPLCGRVQKRCGDPDGSKLRSGATNLLAAGLLSISLIYVFIRLSAIAGSTHRPFSLISEADLWQRIMTFPRILLTYMRLLIFPRHLHMEYLFVEKSPASPYVWLGYLLLIGLGYSFFRYWRSIPGRNVQLKNYLSFFLLWFLIGLAPFYNIVMALHATLYENWVYFPGMGFIALATILGAEAFQKINVRLFKNIAIAVMISLFGYYIFYTMERNRDWSEAMRLYQHDLKYEPNSFILHNNIGVIHYRRGNFKEAREAFLKAIQVSPGGRYDVAHNNIGVIYENEGDLQAAEKYFVASIQFNNYELAYGNLSRLYLRAGKIREAIQTGLEGKELYPLNPEICYYLAISYYYDKQFESASDTFNYLEKISPGYKDVQIYRKSLK